MNKYPNISSGLKLLFVSEILIIISCFIKLVPAVGDVLEALVSLAAFIIVLIGLKRAGREHKYFTWAFACDLINLFLAIAVIILVVLAVVNLSGTYITIATFLGSVSDVLEITIVALVIDATCKLVKETNKGTYNFGQAVLWMYIIITAIDSGFKIFEKMGETTMTVLAIILVIAAILKGVFYMVFLYRASKDVAAL